MGYHIAVVVDWYGPYKIDEARKAAKEFEGGPSSYMLIGQTKGQKSPAKLQYVGVSKKALSFGEQIWLYAGRWLKGAFLHYDIRQRPTLHQLSLSGLGSCYPQIRKPTI